MITKGQLLLNGENVCISSADTPLFEINATMASWVDFKFSVEFLNGAPSAGVLNAAIQSRVPGGQVQYEDEWDTASNLPWFDINDATVGKADQYILGGEFLPLATVGVFVNATPAVPKSYWRRIRGGTILRPILRCAFTGGSTPSWRVSGTFQAIP